MSTTTTETPSRLSYGGRALQSPPQPPPYTSTPPEDQPRLSYGGRAQPAQPHPQAHQQQANQEPTLPPSEPRLSHHGRSKHPPNPEPYTPNPQILHISLRHLRGTASLTPPDSEIPIYNLETRILPRSLTLYLPDTPNPIAEVTYHTFSQNIDLSLVASGTTTSLSRPSLFSRTYTFQNTLTGQTWSWKRGNALKTFDHMLHDERGLPLARISAKQKGLSRIGVIEFIADEQVVAGAKRDEIVASGLGIIYQLLGRQRSSGGIAAGAGASACC